MQRITLIGKTSFIAKSLLEYGIGKNWQWLSHQEALGQSEWIRNTDCVINLAYAPDLRHQIYDPNSDVDSQLAHKVQGQNIHYIMLSSRMVYGQQHDGNELHEDISVAPNSIYGINKHIIEGKLCDILGPQRVTILRPSNIFGFEPARQSFFGIALTKLHAEARITYDMSPFVKRDFFAVRRFGEVVNIIANNPKSGIYNIGSGFGTETGLIAEWLIEGFGGKGELLITNMRRHDIFWLNMDKTYSTFDLAETNQDDLRQDCIKCGVYLRDLPTP